MRCYVTLLSTHQGVLCWPAIASESGGQHVISIDTSEAAKCFHRTIVSPHGWFCQGLKALSPASWRRYVANANTAAKIGLVPVEQPRPLLKYAAAIWVQGGDHPAPQNGVS